MAILYCLWVLAAVIASQFIIGTVMKLTLGELAGQPVFMALYSAFTYGLALALVVLVTKSFWKTSRQEIGLSGLPTWVDVGLAPIAYIISTLLALLFTAIFEFLPWFNSGEVQELGFNTMVMGWDRLLAFVTLVLIAPIIEEIIFRGWLYGKLREKFHKKMPEWGGILLSAFLVSLVFGIVHMQWNVGVNVFALSMVLCLMREMTGTIYAGILTHMIKNAVAFLLLYVFMI